MKKLTVILASLFMAGAMFADPVTSTSGNNLSAFGNVTVSVDKDYSKKKPAELKKATQGCLRSFLRRALCICPQVP